MTVFVSNWGIHMSLTLCLIRSMFQQDLFAPPPARRTIGIPDIVRTIAEHSARPRYTFMVLDLISRVARANGQAGPLVRDGEALVPIREWLATAIAPSGRSEEHTSDIQSLMRSPYAGF